MPSAKITKISKLQKDINNLKNLVTEIKPINNYTTIVNETKNPSSYGLINLIANKTPTFSGWTVDPTDGSDITDGNISTFCTTGNKIAGGAWQYAYFEWDLGAFYSVVVGGVGAGGATAGTPKLYAEFWNGTSWIRSHQLLTDGSAVRVFGARVAFCSKVRFGIASDAPATITPNIREFNVWRLK